MQIEFAHMKCKLSLSEANLFQMKKKNKTNTEEGRKIDFDYIEQICLKYKNKYRTMQGPKYAQRLSLSRASPLLMHDLLLAVSITIQTTSTLPAYACLFVSFWHGVEKIWISNILFSFCKETFNSSLYV